MISKILTKATGITLVAFCVIMLYVSSEWSIKTLKGRNKVNNRLLKSAQADQVGRISKCGESRAATIAIKTPPPTPQRSQLPTTMNSKIVAANPSEELMAIVGYERLAGLQRGCHVNNEKFGLDLDAILKLTPAHRPRYYFSDKYRLLLCEVPKCGSTSWKRALVTMEGIAHEQYPEKIGGGEAHTLGAYLNVWRNFNESDPASVAKTKERISNYTRVMTVREPLERLVSAYKDKMLPTGSGGASFGKISQRIHKAYAGGIENRTAEVSHASWKEFVRYLLDKNRTIYIDAHWQLFSKMCYPCISAYHHIAKLETIHHDAQYVSRLIDYDLSPFFPASKGVSRHHKWSTEYQNYFKSLSKEDREGLYAMYMEQYDLFGYTNPKSLLIRDE